MKFYKKLLKRKTYTKGEYVPYFVTKEFRKRMRNITIPDVEPRLPYEKIHIELEGRIKNRITIPEGEIIHLGITDKAWEITLKIGAIAVEDQSDLLENIICVLTILFEKEIPNPIFGDAWGDFIQIHYSPTDSEMIVNCPGTFVTNTKGEEQRRICKSEIPVNRLVRLCKPDKCQVVLLFDKVRQWVEKFFRLITTSDIDYQPCTRRKQNEWRISGQDRNNLKIPEFSRSKPPRKRKIIRPDTRIRYIDSGEEEVQTRTKIGFSFPVAGHWTFFAYCGMCKGRLFKNKLQHIAPHCIHCGQPLWLSVLSTEPTEEWGVNVLLWKKTWKKDQIRGRGPVTEIEYEVTC